MPLLGTDRTERPRVRPHQWCGRCGRYFAALVGDVVLLDAPSHRPGPFKAASNAVVAEEHAPQAIGPDGAVEPLESTVRTPWSGRPGLRQRTGGPMSCLPPHAPGRGLPRVRRRPDGRRDRSRHPLERRRRLHLHRAFAVASRKGGSQKFATQRKNSTGGHPPTGSPPRRGPSNARTKTPAKGQSYLPLPVIRSRVASASD
jgi:hypothetical protein